MHSAIAALVFGILLFLLFIVGVETSLHSYKQILTLLGLKSAIRSFQKIRVDRADSSRRNPEALEHVRRINVIRYGLHLGVILSASFVLFSRQFSSNTWTVTVIILFSVLAALDIRWRRLIARG
jgi:hypothetical protein